MIRNQNIVTDERLLKRSPESLQWKWSPVEPNLTDVRPGPRGTVIHNWAMG